MNILSTQYSINNKAFEIYLAGCSGIPKCVGCHNPESWCFRQGNNYIDEMDKIMDKIIQFSDMIDNIFILGGEPLDQDRNDLLGMLTTINTLNKSMWLFTRYELIDIDCDIKNQFDYIKTGRYDKSLECGDNIYFGVKLASSNQKIIKTNRNRY